MEPVSFEPETMEEEPNWSNNFHQPRMTSEQWASFWKANMFDPESIPDYMSGKRRPDCTTIQKAAEAGCLDFLRWCADNGFAREFTSTAAGYALKGKQRETFEWLVHSGLITDYRESLPRIEAWKVDAMELGIDEALFELIH